MKKLIIFIFCISLNNCFAQTQYQLSLGAGQSFLQSVNMKTGNIGLKFKQDKNVFIDVNRKIRNQKAVSFGVQAKLNLASYWYELDRSIPYYSERDHIPIFQFESVEITPYIKRYFSPYSSDKFSINIFIISGMCFIITEGSSTNSRYGIRDDNGSQSFQISNFVKEAQKPYIPFLRITGGFEIFKKIGKQHFLGLSPFITWAGLQSERNDLTVLPDDPTYISTGSFKRNRSGYGIRVIFSK